MTEAESALHDLVKVVATKCRQHKEWEATYGLGTCICALCTAFRRYTTATRPDLGQTA